MLYLFAQTNNETNFLADKSLFRSAFQKLWKPSIIINKYECNKKKSFFEVHWDMNMRLVRDQMYYIYIGFDHLTKCMFISHCTSKNDILFLK